MEFRSPVAATEANASSLNYLTKNLSRPEKGEAEFDRLLKVLGHSVDSYRLCFHTQPTLSFDAIRRLGSSRAFQAG